MALLVVLFGVFVIVVGSLGVVQPGALLVAAAGETRYPIAVTVAGVVTLLSAASIPLLGLERIQRFIDWWLARPPFLIRG